MVDLELPVAEGVVLIPLVLAQSVLGALVAALDHFGLESARIMMHLRRGRLLA